jgi:hypothetical protein
MSNVDRTVLSFLCEYRSRKNTCPLRKTEETAGRFGSKFSSPFGRHQFSGTVKLNREKRLILKRCQ